MVRVLALCLLLAFMAGVGWLAIGPSAPRKAPAVPRESLSPPPDAADQADAQPIASQPLPASTVNELTIVRGAPFAWQLPANGSWELDRTCVIPDVLRRVAVEPTGLVHGQVPERQRDAAAPPDEPRTLLLPLRLVTTSAPNGRQLSLRITLVDPLRSGWHGDLGVIAGETIRLDPVWLGGVAPLRWRTTSELPAGLAFDGTTSRLTGCLERTGQHAITIEARDAIGQVAIQRLILLVAERDLSVRVRDQLSAVYPDTAAGVDRAEADALRLCDELDGVTDLDSWWNDTTGGNGAGRLLDAVAERLVANQRRLMTSLRGRDPRETSVYRQHLIDNLRAPVTQFLVGYPLIVGPIMFDTELDTLVGCLDDAGVVRDIAARIRLVVGHAGGDPTSEARLHLVRCLRWMARCPAATPAAFDDLVPTLQPLLDPRMLRPFAHGGPASQQMLQNLLASSATAAAVRAEAARALACMPDASPDRFAVMHLVRSVAATSDVDDWDYGIASEGARHVVAMVPDLMRADPELAARVIAQLESSVYRGAWYALLPADDPVATLAVIDCALAGIARRSSAPPPAPASDLLDLLRTTIGPAVVEHRQISLSRAAIEGLTRIEARHPDLADDVALAIGLCGSPVDVANEAPRIARGVLRIAKERIDGRVDAVRAICRRWPVAASVVTQELGTLLQATNERALTAIRFALDVLDGLDTRRVLPLLRDLVDRVRHRRIRETALQRISEAGHAAAPLLDWLAARLLDPRTASAFHDAGPDVLGRMGPAGLPVIDRLLHSDDERLQDRGVRAARWLVPVVPQLRDWLLPLAATHPLARRALQEWQYWHERDS